MLDPYDISLNPFCTSRLYYQRFTLLLLNNSVIFSFSCLLKLNITLLFIYQLTRRPSRMDKSTLFNQAHQTARNTVAQVGNYMIAFSLALKELYSMTKNTAKSAEQQLIDLGGKLWEQGNMRRVYLSLDVLNSVTNLGWMLNGTKHKFYFQNGGIYKKTTQCDKKTKFYYVGKFTAENGFVHNK